ncbi:hypothetical protein KUTeg_005964 [Tegillarca granosa]|uniref:Beta-1,3-galactosyl-O-glycosyl-glycoprotein beta-1,6-N-acetylglucosaminyltransferase n=1 Tax=Tegillarca granosa TaxID=220873 RepID=A0ABQ9FF74_TEGGR|nr:hypothetical protein KUTeg_005964 [Tegillarca granosa]
MSHTRLLLCRYCNLTVKILTLILLIFGIFYFAFTIQFLEITSKTRINCTDNQSGDKQDSKKAWTEKVFKNEKNTIDANSNKNFQEFKTFQLRKSTDIDCMKITTQDKREIEKSKTRIFPYTQPDYQELFSIGCNHFKSDRGYITSSLTFEEESFPIAYSIVVFKEAAQVERLLRAIYRPQNFYCIHIDIKSNRSFTEIIRNISSCFDNVIISSRSVSPVWGQFSILEPDLICMEDLWKYKKWKYFINLTGQEYPLRTNYELVKILKVYDGANDVDGTIKRANKNRWKKVEPAPHGIKPTKGSLHITANRAFVDYVLHNKTAHEFLNWTKKTKIPDETFFSSLNHNPILVYRGLTKVCRRVILFLSEPETDSVIKPFLSRFVNWGTPPFDWKCHGKRVREVCIFGVKDIPLLLSRPEFFTNKFYIDYQPVTLDCIEEFHYNRTRDQFEKKSEFNTTYYENLPFIRNAKNTSILDIQNDYVEYNVFQDRKSTDIDCVKILNQNMEEILKAKKRLYSHSQSDYQKLLSFGCNHFKSERGYITNSLTFEEEHFPIAYSIVVFKEAAQVERLLRAICRPQNFYCIHIDIKSSNSFTELIRNISSCFDNVFISSRSVSPVWGQFSILEPDLICMKDLWKYKKWKYFINLTGQEYPLRTYYELVKILKVYDGANDAEGTIKRAFVDYVLHNETAQEFLNWTKKTQIPDETFFSSLNHNPQLNIPGSYKGEPETDSVIKPFLTRFVNWGTPLFDWKCHGKRVRMVCIFGVEDIPLLLSRPEFFTNKFYIDYQPVALDCIEEFHYNRTRDQYEQDWTGYITSSLTFEEESFPIAYSIVVFKEAAQVIYGNYQKYIIVFRQRYYRHVPYRLFGVNSAFWSRI